MWFFDRRTKEEKEEDREFQELMNWRKKTATTKAQYRMAVEQEKSGKEIIKNQRRKHRETAQELENQTNQNAYLTAKEKDKIIKRLTRIKQEAERLEKVIDERYKKSSLDKLSRAYRDISGDEKMYQERNKIESKRLLEAVTKKERQRIQKVIDENERASKKASNNFSRATKKYDDASRRWGRRNKSLIDRKNKLNNEIVELEQRLTSDYNDKEPKRQNPFSNLDSEYAKQASDIYRRIDAIYAKMGRYAHLNTALIELKKEYDFRTREIYGESDKKWIERGKRAEKWYDKNRDSLIKKRDRQKSALGLDDSSSTYDELRRLESELRDLEPYLEQELENKRNRAKEDQLAKAAYKKLNSLLQSEDF